MNECIMCRCKLTSSYEGNICDCCLDDLYDSDPEKEVLYENSYLRY